MFNKYVTIESGWEPRDVESVLGGLIKEHDNTLKSISQAEIKSKDRVDIPLSEYIAMRERIEKQESKLRSVYCTIKRLGIPMEVIDGIVPDTIQVYRDEDIRDFVTHYMIKFDVDAGLDILRRSYK
jgi:hypothetical protein